jgi:hypothetical protein
LRGSSAATDLGRGTIVVALTRALAKMRKPEIEFARRLVAVTQAVGVIAAIGVPRAFVRTGTIELVGAGAGLLIASIASASDPEDLFVTNGQRARLGGRSMPKALPAREEARWQSRFAFALADCDGCTALPPRSCFSGGGVAVARFAAAPRTG